MKTIVMILGLTFLFISCSSQKMIVGTTIEDTETNRVLYDIMQNYNKNIEEKNIDNLMKLVSTRYYDNSGTVDTSDDFGYSQLKDVLKKRFLQIKDIFQTIKIKSIVENKTDNKYYVTYEYTAKFLMSIDENKEWHEKSDINQIVFQKEGQEFKIIKGL
jgi:hypothetical protein